MATTNSYNQISVEEFLNDMFVTKTNPKDIAETTVISKVDDVSVDYDKMVNMTALSIKMFANSYYKKAPFIETSDIDQIKDSLNNYAKNNVKLADFKNTIINDLTDFQKQIKSNYVKKLADLGKQKQICERQIMSIEFQKNKLIMDRLSKVVWPYDEKTKEFDAQISALDIKVAKLTQKINELQQTKPVADEKDILMYKMHLKEKFSSKK